MATLTEAKDIIKGTSISTIVSFYHPIHKRGGNFEGICPFHGDSHPSLKINDSKGIYKCFACGAAGDSIKFVQDKLNIEFIDAIKDIANNLGISIEESQIQKDPKYEMALRVLQATNKVYQKVALDNSPLPFKEFLKKRNLSEESIQNFQIGYAPPNNALYLYLQSIQNETDKNLALEIASKIGLIRKNKKGQGHYDFFRDRIMFPVWDHSGKTRGFSSRSVREDQVPKYLNSGESFVFDKGNILYGFNLAKNHIREQDSVIIVEGNMDVIMLHQYGFKNSVATMGVALSQNMVKFLSNMTKNIYLAMDSDPAGIKAMVRINHDFLDEEILPKFLHFAPAKDPDEFLKQFGRLELQKKIESAASFLDFQIESEIPKSIPENTDKKLSILQKIFALIIPLKNTLLAHEKTINAAKRLNLKSSNEDIIDEFKNYKEKNSMVQKTAHRTTMRKNSQVDKSFEYYTSTSPENNTKELFQQEYSSTLNDAPNDVDINTAQNVTISEKLLLETLICHPECILAEQITEILDKIQHFEVKRIVQWLRKIYVEIDESDFNLFVVEKMKEALPGDIKSILASALFQTNQNKFDDKVITKTLNDLIRKLDEGLLKSERDLLRKKQSEAKTDEEGLMIMNEIQQIESKLFALRNK